MFIINPEQIQKDLAALPEEAHHIVIEILKRRYSSKLTQEQMIIDKVHNLSAFQKQEALDFIDFICSRNYKLNDN